MYIIFLIKKALITKGFKQITGIEPAYLAWEASVLPMNYICINILYHIPIIWQAFFYSISQLKNSLFSQMLLYLSLTELQFEFYEF